MNSSAGAIEGHAKVSWGLHIYDAGAPPPMLGTSIWLLVSLIVAVLFLEVRPAAIRHLRASEGHNGLMIENDAYNAADTHWLWRLLVAVWTCALYDAVHRTCCYCVLSVHMLARRHLLPLGNDFFWDGLWTEWVNGVRFYLFCAPSASFASAAAFGSCANWKLPVAGALAYDRYPEHAALNVSSPATPSEVKLYHRVCLASLAITWVSVLALHGQYMLVRRAFFGAASSTPARLTNRLADEPTRAKTGQPMGTHSLATALHATDAPGDDSWVDSPEALAEEAWWRRQDEQLGLKRGCAYCVGTPPHVPALPTSQILWRCWPSLASAVYTTLYAFVGGLPLLMLLLFPAAISVVSVMMMLVTV
ncbi:hypothetical protein GH5_03080 [Leishmania sp. Ghana 2012 LV757]|uniref:hypothetical protein n=1 Tax=Leishmania sp. Ghana 2012 LV757 TaxID=2803181 RepID=UPI001B3D4587|nr:hypothetical protein GH5_03080 [Leishmania sp. Ghana 2012 LV757]